MYLRKKCLEYFIGFKKNSLLKFKEIFIYSEMDILGEGELKVF